jgi:hypothetical protein
MSETIGNSTPEYPDLWRTVMEASKHADETAWALADTQPTTMAGLRALLHYVEEFNARGVALPDDHGWASERMFWPVIEDECDGSGFGFELLANVTRTLETMGAAA